MIAVKKGTVSWRQADELLADEVEFSGQYIYREDGISSGMVWDNALQNIRPRNSAEILADLKAERIAQINDQCRARILAVWPLEKQVSAALGIYGPTELAAMTDWIDAHIAASNIATSAVFDATTQQEMEAVAVTWPV